MVTFPRVTFYTEKKEEKKSKKKNAPVYFHVEAHGGNHILLKLAFTNQIHQGRFPYVGVRIQREKPKKGRKKSGTALTRGLQTHQGELHFLFPKQRPKPVDNRPEKLQKRKGRKERKKKEDATTRLYLGESRHEAKLSETTTPKLPLPFVRFFPFFSCRFPSE
jgi:hypothetical protein